MGFFKTDPRAADEKELAEAEAELQKRPGDVRLLMRAAELEHRLGKAIPAGEHYAQAALRYAEEGFLLKAVAVNKIAFSQQPERAELLEREAGLYTQLDLIQDAFESLKRAILLRDRLGDEEGAWAARRKLLEIDPESAAGRAAVAELWVTEGRMDAALDALGKVALQLHLQGKSGERDRVNARMAFLKRQGA